MHDVTFEQYYSMAFVFRSGVYLLFHLQKYNKTNYVELAGLDDKKFAVMPVPVPEVTYSDVKVDSRYVCFMGMYSS